MKQKKYTWTLYLISITILISILVQVYFNVKNYQLNKIEFINKVQLSLDNASDKYFSDLAKQEKKRYKTFFGKFENQNIIQSLQINKKSDSTNILIKINKRDSINFPKKNEIVNSVTVHSLFKKDDIIKKKSNNFLKTGLETLFISILDKKIDLKKLDTLLNAELSRKNIQVDYKINLYENHLIKDSTYRKPIQGNLIKTTSKSTFLEEGEKIELLFKNNSLMVLKQSFVGILLSLILSIAIISSLFYLLHTIKKQKQISEIKNDFISNITHEFKTPITTIGTAIESIKKFNILKDKVKTDEYLDISKKQLQKLTVMVEKILETSALDSEKLLLKKESVNIITILQKMTRKCTENTSKNIKFTSNTESFTFNADVFHFENAIHNLLDNAIKYGGKNIEVILMKINTKLQILILDDGTIPVNQRNKIFDKFYRIPQGNTHNIKGFGIGLYYAKNIIEKHNGTLKLTKDKNTVFEIILQP